MPDTFFVSEYLKLRSREGRLYPDAVVRTLPQVPSQDPHAREWSVRERSARR
ncbi:MAG: SAM-dependent methyltransferase, partial [Sphingobacteriales bacterium]